MDRYFSRPRWPCESGSSGKPRNISRSEAEAEGGHERITAADMDRNTCSNSHSTAQKEVIAICCHIYRSLLITNQSLHCQVFNKAVKEGEEKQTLDEQTEKMCLRGS